MGDLRYDDVIGRLRTAYDGGARQRDQTGKTEWKISERDHFRQRLSDEGRSSLLELGAGTGQDSLFFADHGLDVVATDLSPQMVEHCKAKGLDAHVMDLLQLDFPDASFDAAYSVNCLLHVPNADLPAVLAAIRRVLRPGGLFFLGVYGHESESTEGIVEDDQHDPPRFFSSRTDEQIQRMAQGSYEIIDFHVVELGNHGFQSLTLRAPGAPG